MERGKLIKSYKPWASLAISRQKTSSSYSPNLKDGKYTLTSEISLDCNDTDKSNNMDSKQFSIKTSVNAYQKAPEKNQAQGQNLSQGIQNNFSEPNIEFIKSVHC